LGMGRRCLPVGQLRGGPRLDACARAEPVGGSASAAVRVRGAAAVRGAGDGVDGFERRRRRRTAILSPGGYPASRDRSPQTLPPRQRPGPIGALTPATPGARGSPRVAVGGIVCHADPGGHAALAAAAGQCHAGQTHRFVGRVLHRHERQLCDRLVRP
jgi:hypothetical protein